jgi:hypothetical protein
MPSVPTITVLDNVIKKPKAKNLEAIYPIVIDDNHVLYFDDATRAPETIGGTPVYFHRLTLKLGIGETSYPLEFEENIYTNLWTIREQRDAGPGDWYLYLAADQQGWGYLQGQLFLSKMFPNFLTNLLSIKVSDTRTLFAIRMANIRINARYLGQTEMSYSVVISDPYQTNIRVEGDTVIYEDLNPGATILINGIPTLSEYLYLNIGFSRFRKPLAYDPTKTFEVQPFPMSPKNYKVYIASNQSEWDKVNPNYKGQFLFLDTDYDTGEIPIFPRYIGGGVYLEALYVGEVSMAFRKTVSPYDNTVMGYLCDTCRIVRDVEGDKLNWAAPDDPHSYGELIFVDNKQPTREIGGTTVTVDGLSNLLPVFHYRPCLHGGRYTTPKFSYEKMVTGDYNIYLASDQKAWDQFFGEGVKGNLFLTDPTTDFVMNAEFFKERSGFWYNNQVDPYKSSDVPLTSTVKLKEVFPLKYGVSQTLHAIYLTSARIIMSKDGTGIERVIFNNKYSSDPRLIVDENHEILFNDESPWVDVDGYRVEAKNLTLKRTSFYYRLPITMDLNGIVQSPVFGSATYNVYISGNSNWLDVVPNEDYRGVLFLVEVGEDPDKDWFPSIRPDSSVIHAKYVGQVSLSVETVENSYTGDTTYRITSAKALEGSDSRLSVSADNDLIFSGGSGAVEIIGYEEVSVENLRLKLPQDSYRPVILFDFMYLRGLSLTYRYFDTYTTRYDTAIATLQPEWALIHSEYPGKMFLRPTWAALAYYNNNGMDPYPGNTNPRTDFPVAVYSLGSFSWVFKKSVDPYSGIVGHRLESVKTNDFYKQDVVNPDHPPRGFFWDHFGNVFYDRDLDDNYDVTADWLNDNGGEWENPQYLHLSVFHYRHHFFRPTDLIESLGEGVFENRNYNIFLASNQRDWLYQVGNGRNYKGKMFLTTEEPDGNDLLVIPYADPDTGAQVYLYAKFMGSVDISLSNLSVKATYQLSYDAESGDLIYSDTIDPVLEIDTTDVDVSHISLQDAPGRYRLPLSIDANSGYVKVIQELGGVYNVYLTPDKDAWGAFQHGYRASMFLSEEECDPVTGLKYFETEDTTYLKAIKVGSVDFEWNCDRATYKYRVIKMEPLEIVDNYCSVTPDGEWIKESPTSQIPGEQERYPTFWYTRLGPGRPRPPVGGVSEASEDEIVISVSTVYASPEEVVSPARANQLISIGPDLDNVDVEPYVKVSASSGSVSHVLSINGVGQSDEDITLSPALLSDSGELVSLMSITGLDLRDDGIRTTSANVPTYAMRQLTSTHPTFGPGAGGSGGVDQFSTPVVSDGKIYCWYGYLNEMTGSHNNYLAIYDIATNHWSLGRSNTRTRTYFMSSIAFEGKIYYFGGRASDDPPPAFQNERSDTMDIYDIATDTWSEGEPYHINESLDSVTRYVFVRDRGMYLFPSDTYLGQPSSIFIYDIDGNSWVEGVPIDTFPDWNGVWSATLVGDAVFCLWYDVVNYAGFGATFKIFSLETNNWLGNTATQEVPSPYPTYPVLFNNGLFLAGYTDPDGVESYTYNLSEGWLLVPAVSSQYFGNRLIPIVWEDKVYLHEYNNSTQNFVLECMYPIDHFSYPTTPYVACTTSMSDVDTSGWGGILSLTIDDSVPSGCRADYAVSFDAGRTWKIFVENAWKTICKWEINKWWYLADTAWVLSPLNSATYALRRAAQYGDWQWSSLEVASLMQDEWQSEGGFQRRSTKNLNFCVSLLSNGSETAVCRGFTVAGIGNPGRVEKSLTFKAITPMETTDIAGLITYWSDDAQPFGHFEGVTKHLEGSSVVYSSGTFVGLPSKDGSYPLGVMIRVRDAGIYIGDHMVLDAVTYSQTLWEEGRYYVFLGNYTHLVIGPDEAQPAEGEIFFTKVDPRILARLHYPPTYLGLVDVKIVYEDYSTLRPLFIFDSFWDHSAMMNVTSDKYDIEYYWNGPQPTWLPGIAETQIIESITFYDHIRLGPISYRPPLLLTASGGGKEHE